jgi:hypothetical protein
LRCANVLVGIAGKADGAAVVLLATREACERLDADSGDC